MSGAGRKRGAEGELTKDNQDDDRDNEDFVTTPQIADESEMATRRIVRVRRPEGTAASAPATAGAFSSLLAAKNGNSSAPVSGGFGSGFGFGKPATGGAAPAFGFGAGFGAMAATPADATANPPATFSFGTAVPTAEKSKEGEAPKAAPAFSFTKPADSSATPSSTPSATAAAPAAPLFGANAFSFGNAVSSFVEARRKMQEEKKEQGGENGEGEEDEPADGEEDSGFGAAVEATPGETLASGQSKLYLYEKGADGAAAKWAERGMGLARLKKQEKDGESGKFVYRLLVRDGYSLNATLGKNMLAVTKAEEKHLIITAASSDGPKTYLLKFTGPNAVENTKKMADELKAAIKAAEE